MWLSQNCVKGKKNLKKTKFRKRDESCRREDENIEMYSRVKQSL